MENDMDQHWQLTVSDVKSAWHATTTPDTRFLLSSGARSGTRLLSLVLPALLWAQGSSGTHFNNFCRPSAMFFLALRTTEVLRRHEGPASEHQSSSAEWAQNMKDGPRKQKRIQDCQRARFSLCCRLLTLVSFKVSVLMLQIEKDIKQRFRAANQMLCQFSQCWIATTQHFPAFSGAEVKKKKKNFLQLFILASLLSHAIYYLRR